MINNPGSKWFRISRHSLKHWLNLTVMILFALAIMIFIDIISTNHNHIFDLTPTQKYTLSDQCKKILKSQTKNIKVTVFYEKGKRAEYEDLLRRYSYETPYFSYALINLDRNPAKAKKYRATSYGDTIVESGTRSRKIGYPNEEQIITAILKVTQEKPKVIYFLAGHGENDPFDSDKKKGCSAAREALIAENYEVKKLALTREEEVPPDTSLLIVSGPKKELFKEELDRIAEFIQKGGELLFMIDPYTVPELVGFLRKYQVILGDDIVVDKGSRLFGGDYLTPIIPLYNQKHPITKGFNLGNIFALARSVEVKEGKGGNISGLSFIKTDPESWAETDKVSVDQGKARFQDGKDKAGPVSVGVAVSVEDKAEGKEKKIKKGMVVFGDSDFINNFYFNLLGNKDLFLNTVSFLAEEENLISLRPKSDQQLPLSSFYLTDRQGKIIFWCLVIFQPSLIFLLGMGVFIRRKIKG